MSNSPVLWALQLCTIPCGALFFTCNPLGPFPLRMWITCLQSAAKTATACAFKLITVESRLSSSYDFAFFLHKLWKIGVCLWKSKSFSKYFHCQDLKRVYNVKILWYAPIYVCVLLPLSSIHGIFCIFYFLQTFRMHFVQFLPHCWHELFPKRSFHLLCHLA